MRIIKIFFAVAYFVLLGYGVIVILESSELMIFLGILLGLVIFFSAIYITVKQAVYNSIKKIDREFYKYE